MNAARRPLLSLTLLFVVITIGLAAIHRFLATHGLDKEPLLIANSIIFAMSIVALMIQQNALKDKNPNVFIRSVMATMMIRMLVCVLGVILYKFFSGAAFSTTIVFASLFLYLIYLAVEVSIIMKLNKKKNG